MSCQVSCKYCFGPNSGETMQLDVVDKAIDFIEQISPENKKLHITFHGGEPLLAAKGYYETLLPKLKGRFGRRLRLSMQSNLLTLDDHMISLISKYDIAVGTSVDGFEQMCNEQRGEGYYKISNQARGRLRQHGIDTHCICTFTHGFAQSNDVRQAFDSFASPYSIHGAVCELGKEPNKYTVSVDDMTTIFTESLAVYRENIAKNHISTIDAMVKGCFEGRGNVCTFFDCLGSFAAIASDGRVYSCQRFCGHEEFCFGNVLDDLTKQQILESNAYKRLLEKQNKAKAACSNCTHLPYCSGGCLYNMFASDTEKDPYCEAYKKTFDSISLNLAMEMGGLMTGSITPQNAPLLAMAGDVPHPYDVEQNEQRMRVALKRAMPDREGMPQMKIRERRFPEKNRNKLYLHTTFDCPLRCNHCYANGGINRMPEMPVHIAGLVVHEAQTENFNAVVVTGGEPLVHSEIDKMLADFKTIDLKGMRLILRTSLAFPISDARLKAVYETFTEIMVSIDGDKKSHDARRGKGRYDLTVNNLEHVKVLGYLNKFGVCATLPRTQCEGREGKAVDELCKRLGITNIRFHPILPIGRAAGIPNEEAFICMDADRTKRTFRPRHTCGLGQNLYVEPDGNAYPCYAWCSKDKLLGNVRNGLYHILQKEVFKDISGHDVDTNEKCKTCSVRYLCGGMCKAWVNDKENIDSGDFACTVRKAAFTHLAETIKM
jgi:uncharacterized protein